MEGSQQFHDMDDLRNYVNETLCENYQLLCGAFPMTERVLMRGSRPCGVFFCVHGPRAVRAIAIWETERNRVLFYGADGQRFQNVQLARAPRLRTLGVG